MNRHRDQKEIAGLLLKALTEEHFITLMHGRGQASGHLRENIGGNIEYAFKITDVEDDYQFAPGEIESVTTFEGEPDHIVIHLYSARNNRAALAEAA